MLAVIEDNLEMPAASLVRQIVPVRDSFQVAIRRFLLGREPVLLFRRERIYVLIILLFVFVLNDVAAIIKALFEQPSEDT